MVPKQPRHFKCAAMSEAGFDHNGGPPAETLTLKRKIDCARAILQRTDLTSAQKCVGLWLVIQSDKDWTSEARTSDLQQAASAKDRETVFRATRDLDAKGIIAKASGRGQGGKYTILPPRVVDAVVEAYDDLKSGRVEADHSQEKWSGETGRVGSGTVVGFNRTGRAKPVGFEPTTSKQSGETGRVSPDHSLRAEVSNNINNNNNLTQHTSEPVSARASVADLNKLSERLIAACNGALDNPVNCQGLLHMGTPMMWLEGKCDLEKDIIPTLEAIGKLKHGKRIRSWDYFSGAVYQQRDKRMQGAPPIPKSSEAAKPQTDQIDAILHGGRR